MGSGNSSSIGLLVLCERGLHPVVVSLTNVNKGKDAMLNNIQKPTDQTLGLTAIMDGTNMEAQAAHAQNMHAVSLSC